jgi:hypothetical protein
MINTKRWEDLKSLAEIIYELLQQSKGENTGDLFLDICKFKEIMVSCNPAAHDKKRMEAIRILLNNMCDHFKKDKAPADFKKTYLYASIYNWTATLCDYINYTHAVEDS